MDCEELVFYTLTWRKEGTALGEFRRGGLAW